MRVVAQNPFTFRDPESTITIAYIETDEAWHFHRDGSIEQSCHSAEHWIRTFQREMANGNLVILEDHGAILGLDEGL